jgi:hypothetical protein
MVRRSRLITGHARENLGAYSLRFAREELHCGLSGKPQVLIAPSRMHDAGGRVRILAENQVAQFMSDDTAQDHLELPATPKFPNPVRVHIGHYSKSFVLG